MNLVCVVLRFQGRRMVAWLDFDVLSYVGARDKDTMVIENFDLQKFQKFQKLKNSRMLRW